MNNMSNLTKLEEVASRIAAGFSAGVGGDYIGTDWAERIARNSVEAAQAVLAECARHEPTVNDSLTVPPEIPWMDHDGRERPCVNGRNVELLFRDGMMFRTRDPADYPWNHANRPSDIMKWRPVS